VVDQDLIKIYLESPSSKALEKEIKQMIVKDGYIYIKDNVIYNNKYTTT